MSEFKTVTHSMPKKDAREKIRGDARYTDDLRIEGALYAGLVRSPYHHARLVAIDVEPALEIEGVVRVITSKDIPGIQAFGPILQDRPVLAVDVVRHMGEPVALVVAENRRSLAQGVKAVGVQYEILPAVLAPRDAISDGAIQIHPDGNLVSEYRIGRGDVEKGFALADMEVEDTFHLSRVAPGYLEPETAAAEWNSDGTLVVWVSSQKPFEDRTAISHVLGIEEDLIHVRGAVIGGAFGGKEDSGLPILAALGAWLTRRAVRMANTREESFQAHPKRHAGVVRCRLGATVDGLLVALQVDALLDTGAYASYGPAVGGAFTEIAAGPYRTPNVDIHTRVVYTNAPFSGAMRGFGAPQAAFALESMMDVLANRLGIDPVGIRRLNAWRKGDRTPTGVLLLEEPSIEPCLAEVEKSIKRLQTSPLTSAKQSGIGFALLLQAMGLGNGLPDDMSNRITWLPGGRVRVDTGTPDLGQGTQTVAAQIAAEALGLDYGDIELADLDTSRSPRGGVSCASRMTYMVGNATMLAAESAIESLISWAASALKRPPHDLRYEAGRVLIVGQEGESFPADEFVARAADEGEVLSGDGTFSFPYPPETTPQGLPVGMPHVMFGYGAHVARVEVDPAMGTVDVKEIVAIHDIGRAINPVGVQGQIEGGVAMGVGYALQEEVKLSESGHWTDNFTEYLLPTHLDVPVITTIVLEHPEPTGPLGARGVAEMSLTPVAPAIANAVAQATGKRIRRLPIRPEDLVGL